MIYQGDVLHIPLPDKSVDLVFGSPPYEAARDYGIGFSLSAQDWVDWAVAGYKECLRVSRGLVAWVVGHGTGGTRHWSAAPMLLAADLHRAGVWLRNPALFLRSGIPGSGGRDWLRADAEYIICGGPSTKLPWSDTTVCGKPPKYQPGGAPSHRLRSGKRVNRPNRQGVGSRTECGDEIQAYKPPKIANPGNLIRCAVGGGRMGSPLSHQNEAPFPEALAEFFVRSFCPPDGIVLDPFSGSGTTGAAALRWGRQTILGDIRMNQCILSRERVHAPRP